MKKTKLLKALLSSSFLSYGVAQTLDLVTTWVGLDRGFEEVSYFAATMYERFGALGLVSLKYAGVAMIGLITLAAYTYAKKKDDKELFHAQIILSVGIFFAAALAIPAVVSNGRLIGWW